VLENLILGRIGLAVVQNKEVKPVHGEVKGLAYRGFRSPDRTVSSYVARLGDAVVVTNSPYQLERLAAVRAGTVKSIASLPEYTFFRIRYPLGDPAETALILVSDPTIRRLCGPRWRIADSRRTRAAAVLAELQASQLDALARKKVKPGPIYTDLPIPGGGELTLASQGVVSSSYGSLKFMTPLGELALDEVTQAEASAYQMWRDGYQRNWTWAFDPIALRIGLGKQRLSSDLTVMPLIVGSEYNQFLSISRGGKFAPTAGDPHGALAHFIIALNRESPMFRSLEGLTASMGQTISLGWIGQSISVYAEDSSFWKDLERAQEQELPKFMEKNLGRVPVAVRIDAPNPLKLAAFLTTARAFIEQTGPGLTHWDSLKYKDQPYVRVTPVKGGTDSPVELENLAVYYTTLGGALTITLSEKVLQGTIDRWIVKTAVPPEGKTAERKAEPWLGSNVGLQVDHRILDVVNTLGRNEYQRTMQSQCWSNLPILNGWKRLYPDRDPVEVHRAVWAVEPICPGGGKYVWNEKHRTMESTVYGHPGEPKHGPAAPPVLSSFATANFGLTLENGGLRAQVTLRRAPVTKQKSP
jgi:hypothetical protein